MPIGVLLALGLARWRGRGAGVSNFIMLFPLVTPEIVMGVSLLLVFSHFFTFIHTGTPAQVLGHVTFSISFVVVVVRGGCSRSGGSTRRRRADWRIARRSPCYRVLLPLLRPAIVAGAAIVFALSIDDFVISLLALERSGHRHGARSRSTPRRAPRRCPRPTPSPAIMSRSRSFRSLVGYLGYRSSPAASGPRAAGMVGDMAAFDI